MIYLASPYSHSEKMVEQLRYEQTRDFTLARIAEGVTLFSPIVYGHHFVLECGMPGDAASWEAFNEEFIRRSKALWVLQLPGWELSKGVLSEIRYATTLGLTIMHFYPSGERA